MMSVPFLYVNLTALACYALLSITFLASKKTPEILSFICLLLDFTLWTGASVLMRLQVYPGVNFWFYVSILALFALPLFCYLFVSTFVRSNDFFTKIFVILITLVILVCEAFGVFLKPPVVHRIQDGQYVFLYDMQWPIYIALFLLIAIIVVIFILLRHTVKEQGSNSPGLKFLIIGLAALAVGNMMQIIPDNVFPWDTLSGIVFALLLLWALYKRHLFRMTLIVSRSVLLLALAALVTLASLYFITPLKATLMDTLRLDDNAATTWVVVVFSLLLAISYFLLRRLLGVLFTREAQQNVLIKEFSDFASQSLDTSAIMEKLVQTISEEIPTGHINVCLPENGQFINRYTSDLLAPTPFSISSTSPCLTYLHDQEPYLILEEFKGSPLYLSLWKEEQDLYRSLDLHCMVAMRNGGEITGLLLISNRERNLRFSYAELTFLTTLSSIASIAVKHATLYEQMYREARIDNLTNVYNYRYFVEEINEEFERCRSSSLALLYVDLDDLKLYNMLNGARKGDEVLCRVAEILTHTAGENGKVFRYSGKVFAVLLPGYDMRRTEELARGIQKKIHELNDGTSPQPLSASCGICVAPYAASNAKELMNNADLAVFNAKNSGKHTISIFENSRPVFQNSAQRAQYIIAHTEKSSNATRRSNNAIINSLTAAIDAKDHYTFAHSRNVARYAAILAVAAGLNDEQVSVIYEAGLLHDIGKISISEAILSKQGKLTDEEMEIMRGHVNNSIDMIRHLSSMDYLIPAVVGHHERWDGKGYPTGIAREDIPITARCLALADSFDAMTSDRPYRKGLPVSYAAEQIRKNEGTQFDPALSEIFLSLIEQGEISPANMKDDTPSC